MKKKQNKGIEPRYFYNGVELKSMTTKEMMKRTKGKNPEVSKNSIKFNLT